MSKNPLVFSKEAELLELYKQYGSPLYVYSADVMKRQYQSLAAALSDVDYKINYACKALSNVNVLRIFKALGAGLDTVSIQEIHLGLHAGFKPEDIIFTPNGIGFDEYREAMELGVRINIDSLSILEDFGEHFGDSYPVCLRINPHIMAGGNSKISTGHIDSKFGISIHQFRHLQRIVAKLNLRIEGLHMHTGSDILNLDSFISGADILFSLAHEFEHLKYIDLGSGFRVPYHSNDNFTDIEQFGARICERFKNFCENYNRDIRLEFEPGKYLVSQAGVFLCRVNSLKQTTATVFAQTDTGFNHFIRPMFYDAHHEILNISNPKGAKKIYTVVGNICETDTFATDRSIQLIREGDILAFLNAGAYCYQMSSNYNSRFRPAEVLISGNDTTLIRKRETMEDILRNQLLPEEVIGK
jgi:diaminopimelate decarboxylase